jgi:hypothetical protein
MSTEKQIAANRANSQRSTGPRTDAGKAASSQNALRHGLTASGLIILPGQEEAFAELESGLRGSLKPDTPLHEVIFKRIVECAWKLERCRLAEIKLNAILGHENSDPLLDTDTLGRFASIQKYAREAENSMFKCIRELGKLQTESQFRNESSDVQASAPHALSEACSLTQILKNVIANCRNEAKTSQINMETELKALSGLPPAEYIRRFEANPSAAEPSPDVVRAAAA